MGLKEKNWSEGVVKWMDWLSGVMDFEMAEQVLQQIGQVNVSDTSIWRCTQERGEKFRRLAEEERAQAMSISGYEESLRRLMPKGRMGVAMDGGMINIRGEGWKELKVGSIFDVEVIPAFDEEMRGVKELGHAVHTSYVAHLGGPKHGSVGGNRRWRVR